MLLPRSLESGVNRDGLRISPPRIFKGVVVRSSLVAREGLDAQDGFIMGAKVVEAKGGPGVRGGAGGEGEDGDVGGRRLRAGKEDYNHNRITITLGFFLGLTRKLVKTTMCRCLF